MSAEENRSASNLLLLCLFHSNLVDAKDSEFPIETLREWKEDQIKQGGGFEISDTQAREAIEGSIRSEITLQAEVINVGGQWGGGGGAIGRDAVGGPGGDNIWLNLDGLFPGGGGGALSGPGRTPPDGRRAKPGKGSSVGMDGGDTFISDGEGNVLAFARGGSASSSPYGERGHSGPLSISSMMICNSFELRDGLVFVLGGAWQSTSLTNTPQDLQLPLLLVIEAGGVDAGHYSIHLIGHDPDGRVCGQARFPVIVDEPGDILRLARAAPLGLHVESYGLYTISAYTDDAWLASIDLAVSRVTDA